MKFYDYDDNNVLQTAAETTIIWDSANEPTNYKWSQILYDIRRADANQNLFLEPITEREILDYYADQILSFDALVVQNNRLEKEMKIFERLMNNAGENIKVSAMQQTQPFTKNGVANVCNIFELSDGQTITIFFHSPDTTPKKITPTDNLISYKWVLNKKDITIVVAPERGKDLNVREVCRRIMKLAEKNSAAFARANKNRAEKAQKLADTESEISQLETQLTDLQQQLEIAKVKRDELQIQLAEQSSKDFRDDGVKVSIKNINEDIKFVANTAFEKRNELQQQLQSITDPIEYKLLSNKIKYLKALQSAMENRDSLFSKWDYGTDLSEMTDVDLIETDNIEKVIDILDKLATNKHYSISKDDLFKLIGFTPSENIQKQEVNNAQPVDENVKENVVNQQIPQEQVLECEKMLRINERLFNIVSPSLKKKQVASDILEFISDSLLLKEHLNKFLNGTNLLYSFNDLLKLFELLKMNYVELKAIYNFTVEPQNNTQNNNQNLVENDNDGRKTTSFAQIKKFDKSLSGEFYEILDLLNDGEIQLKEENILKARELLKKLDKRFNKLFKENKLPRDGNDPYIKDLISYYNKQYDYFKNRFVGHGEI